MPGKPFALASVCALVLIGAAPAQAAAAAGRISYDRTACVNGAGTAAVAVFDVTVRGGRPMYVKVGSSNRVKGGAVLGAQRERFAAGATRSALKVRFTSSAVSWKLGSSTLRVVRGSAPCASATSTNGTHAATPSRPVVSTPLPVSSAQPAATNPQPAAQNPLPAATVVPSRTPVATPSPVATLTPAQPISPTRATSSVFAPGSFWNALLPDTTSFAAGSLQIGTAQGSAVMAPINPTAGQELASYATKSDGSSNTWINYRNFTSPITRVATDVPLQPVRLCRTYPNDCVPSWANNLDRTLRGIARNGSYLGGGVAVPAGFTPPTDSDAAAVLYQPDYIAPDGKKGRVWELWRMRQNPDYNPALPVSPTNAYWMAAWGGRMVGTNGEGSGSWSDCWWSGCGYQANTSVDPDAWGRPDSQAREKGWGATATSLSLLGTEVNLDDCRTGVINHAVGIEVPDARSGYWWPAQRGDGSLTTKVLTEGMRLRLPSGAVKPAGLTTIGSAMWDAAYRYGFVIDDKTYSSLNFRVEPGCESMPWWGGVATYNQMRNFPWADLRVLAQGNAAQPTLTN